MLPRQPAPEISATHKRLSALIGHIYDCVLDPAHWERALTEIAHEFLLAKAMLGVLRLDTGQTILGASAGVEPGLSPGR